jgi:integrase
MVDRHAESAGADLVSPHAFRRMLADYWDEVHGLGGRAALKKQLGHAPNSADVTERHYLTKNIRRIAREIGKWHTSPLQAIPVDWSTYPVHIPK